NVPEGYQLELSYIGHVATTIMVAADVGIVALSAVQSELDEVMVNTGYQQFSMREHVGSTDGIDAQTIQKRTASNILDRLEGMLSGVTFDRNQSGGNTNSNMRVRGLSSING